MIGADTSLLFVYGTLMESVSGICMGTTERTRLHAASTPLGPATMRGTLYDLGAYPALVIHSDAVGVVHGEVLQFTDAERVFKWLDAYEGIDPARPDDGEYLRVVRSARLADGLEVEAWVYVYRETPTQGAIVTDGCWRPSR